MDTQTATNWYPTDCVNCDAPSGPKLYCSERCQQMAEIIRYARRSRRDGRIDRDPLVAQAIQTRVALVLGGGYPHKSRRLSPEIRRSVVARDQGLCRSCGAPGSEVDHIADSSDALSNLQLLCRSCHMAKTWANAAPIDPQDKVTLHMAEQIQSRIYAPHPQRVCDDDQTWSDVYRGLSKQARELHASGEGTPTDDIYSFGDDPRDGSPESEEHADYLAELNGRDG